MNYPICDGHCDTALELFAKGESLLQASGHLNLKHMGKFSNFTQFFAFCPVEKQPGDAPNLFEKALQNFLRELDLHQDSISLCHNTAQMREAWNQGKTSAFLSIEGAEALDCDVSRLEDAKAKGVSMIALTWNYPNALAGSHLTGQGLSAKGKEFAREAQRLGMILDVSHLSDQGVYDLLDITEKPLVASHSNSRRLCQNSRNLTDKQFCLIAQTGGTVGLNLYPPFLREDGKADFYYILRHVEHFLSLDSRALALGMDLDGFCHEMQDFRNLGDLSKLLSFLEQNGIDQNHMKNICAGNLLRVMDACL